MKELKKKPLENKNIITEMRNAFDELINQLDGSRPRSPELEDISIEAAESGKTEEQKKIQNKTTELFKVVESQLLKAEIVSSTNGVGMMDIHLQKKKKLDTICTPQN